MSPKQMPFAGTGRLPNPAPLDNPYVPFQTASPARYDTPKALVRGTLFPGLDLPFMGMVNKTNLPSTPQTQLQALAFAIQELALYLDTHQEDMEALQLYRQYQTGYAECLKQHEQSLQPLNHLTPTDAETYQWLNDPWPWEYAGNEGV